MAVTLLVLVPAVVPVGMVATVVQGILAVTLGVAQEAVRAD